MFLRPIYLFRMLCLCAFCVVAGVFACSVRVASASDFMTVTSQTDMVNFPKYIDFNVSANDAQSSITQATLYITFDVPYFASEHTVRSQPARMVTLHWREDIMGNNFRIPGIHVHYYWLLQDSAGHQLTSTVQQFTMIDTRFSWQHVSQGMLQVNWYNRPQDFGRLLFQDASRSLMHVSRVLGGGPSHFINLWVYETDEDFQGSLPPGSYEWVGGIAFPMLNEGFISVSGSADDTLIRDMPHELTHLVFHQLTSQGISAPTWFDEGLAVYNQEFHEPEMSARLQKALLNHTLLRLNEISFGFPADANAAYLAYAESWNLIDYMYSTFGQAKMDLLIQKMNNASMNFSGDLTAAIGEDTIHLENQWRVHLHQFSILSPSEITPIARPIPQQQTISDSHAPLLIALGILLIVGPMVAIAVLLFMQRGKRQKAVEDI